MLQQEQPTPEAVAAALGLPVLQELLVAKA
jgi:hypothetical protein